jgi:hypothetical protein
LGAGLQGGVVRVRSALGRGGGTGSAQAQRPVEGDPPAWAGSADLGSPLTGSFRTA